MVLNMEYERSVIVKCSCGITLELPLDESEPIEITGKPKNIAERKCTNCGKQIILYGSLWIKSY